MAFLTINWHECRTVATNHSKTLLVFFCAYGAFFLGQFLPELSQLSSSQSVLLLSSVSVANEGVKEQFFSDTVELVAEDSERKTTTVFINGELQILPFVLSERVRSENRN
jgi:hypothetical protein